MPTLQANDAMVEVLVTQIRSYADMIGEIDAELGESSPAASKNKVLETLADSVASQLGSLGEQVEGTVDSFNGDERVAVVAYLRRVLRQFDPEVKQYLDSQAPEQSQPTTVDIEKIKELRETRKTLVSAYGSARALLQFSAPDKLVDFPEIHNLKGAIGGTGKRGERLAAKYVWVVDGKEVAGHTPSHVGVATGTTATDVRLAIEQQVPGFDYKNPPATFSFTVNDKHVSASRLEDTNGSVAHAEADDEDESDEDASIFDS